MPLVPQVAGLCFLCSLTTIHHNPLVQVLAAPHACLHYAPRSCAVGVGRRWVESGRSPSFSGVGFATQAAPVHACGPNPSRAANGSERTRGKRADGGVRDIPTNHGLGLRGASWGTRRGRDRLQLLLGQLSFVQ